MSKYNQMLDAYAIGDVVCKHKPFHVYVEPTNMCTLHCSHCPCSKSKRPKGYMNVGLYQNIVSQCRAMGIPWIYLFHLGEPMLHDDIRHMVDYARTRDIKIRLHTNGTIDCSGISADALYISLNETPFELIRENVDTLIREGKPFKLLGINGVLTSLPPKYHQYVIGKKHYNWANRTAERCGEQVRCSHPYKSMTILWDGRCVPCCVDYDGDCIIGNAWQQSLSQIWNSEEMRAIRETPAPMCMTCNVPRIPEPRQYG